MCFFHKVFQEMTVSFDKGLKSDEYTSYDWESYMFRIVNLTNPNRRLDVLDLDKISDES